ncbi:MAG: hypothetical protein KatS3mg027_2040 [Bacteroidia bacterium]|nr:MAG: hypothetical protein KatS3mg027_2040 [Bacteroidia bacterium]
MREGKLIGILGLSILLTFCKQNNDKNTLNDIYGLWKITKCKIDTTRLFNETLEINSDSSFVKDTIPVVRKFEAALLLAVFPKLLAEVGELQYIEITKEKVLFYDSDKKEVESYPIESIIHSPLFIKIKTENDKEEALKVLEVKSSNEIIVSNKKQTLEFHLMRERN